MGSLMVGNYGEMRRRLEKQRRVVWGTITKKWSGFLLITVGKEDRLRLLGCGFGGSFGFGASLVLSFCVYM